MQAQNFNRRVYSGAPIDNVNTVSAIRYTPFAEGEKFRTYKVNNLSDYESGCHEHKRCFGHMCTTSGDIVLPPQSMAMRTMNIATEYHAASRLAFSGQKEEYINALKRTNYTKDGTMRCTMSTPVLGSGRLIATPMWEYGTDVVALSPELASKMKVCKRETDENGNMLSVFREDTLQEGDMVILVRPPSLGIYNTQPLKVVFWNNQCIGIHPETFSAYHGDFDGDEAQMYPIYESDSIQESQGWSVMPLPAFEEGRKVFATVYPMLYDNRITHKDLDNIMSVRGHLYGQQSYDKSRARFINFTTLSSAQMMQSNHKLVFGKHSRNKDHHISGMHDRFNNKNLSDSFVSESIRGTQDVTKQQLSQGALGYMSRVAKIAASCFFRHPKGSLYVVTRRGTKLLVDDKRIDTGTPSVRAISLVCSVAQQAALDSHRAEAHAPATHDFIADLILGCNKDVNRGPTSHLTMVELDKLTTCSAYTQMCRLSWIYESHDSIFVLCDPTSIKRNMLPHIRSTYNPRILSMLQRNGINIHEVCKRGIRIICNYYSINMSDIEMSDLASVVSYEPHRSTTTKANHENDTITVTSREGISARNLGWIETLLATDYTRLPELNGDFEEANTSTAAMFISNFSNLKLKNA